MMRSRFFAVAAVFAIAACTDNPNAVLTGPIDPAQPLLPTPSRTTIAGRISVQGSGADRLVEITDATGRLYRLVGNEARALASVDGGDVVVRGTLDGNPGLVVEDFQVTGMYGRPALDGVLEATDEGFALRFTDGSLRVIAGLSSDCAEHVGARLWVIGWDAESPVQFGLIAAI
jgi:ABC-type Fe3+-hydroxamate transport system substrate-binding protein